MQTTIDGTAAPEQCRAQNSIDFVLGLACGKANTASII